jgi:hypothetical protein
MRKLYLIVFLFAGILNCTNAQYKKASFLNKKGRTYDLGSTAAFLGAGNSPCYGFYFSYGKERSDKRLFHWFDLEYKRRASFSYNTFSKTVVGNNATSTPVSVSGKSLASFTYRYNLAYFLVNNGNDDNIVLPFVSLSISYIGLGGRMKYTISPNALNDNLTTKVNEEGNLGLGAGIGGGAIYKLNKKISLKGTLAYYGIYSLETESNSKVKNSVFVTVPNHLAINIGFHWLLDRDND